jgi:hypothetical protein
VLRRGGDVRAWLEGHAGEDRYERVRAPACNGRAGAGHLPYVTTTDRHERLRALFAQHAEAVRGYALRRTDPHSADDVVSEVFVVACRR